MKVQYSTHIDFKLLQASRFPGITYTVWPFPVEHVHFRKFWLLQTTPVTENGQVETRNISIHRKVIGVFVLYKSSLNISQTAHEDMYGYI